MKIITKKYKVFNFDELSKESQEKAISDEINFILETKSYENMQGNFKKAVDEAERMKTPWFTNSYVYDYCKNEIIKILKINNYVFLENGKLFIE